MKIRYNLLIILLAAGLAAGSVWAVDKIHFGTYTPEQFRDFKIKYYVPEDAIWTRRRN
jgi:hypothetical protein